jgi:hypothetical protein
MEHITKDLVNLCERVLSGEAIRLISWELKEKHFFLLFRERRRGKYFQMRFPENNLKSSLLPTPNLYPKFRALLEPDDSLWPRLTKSAPIEDWCALDELVYLSLKFSDSEIRLLGQYSIGEDVADEALERYRLYIPNSNLHLLPALMFENRNLGIILIIYLKHSDGFAKESILCDDNNGVYEVLALLIWTMNSPLTYLKNLISN